ncbi:MAG TPA: hypothetical protein VL326_12605 [Kofleriaceae bacterium]|nr:hypothetical protein [Kofleriaceae bacterium]
MHTIGLQLFATTLALTSSIQPRTIERPKTESPAARIRVDSSAKIAREDLVMRDAGSSMIGTLTLKLAANDVIAASTMIELPRGSRALGMTLDHAGEPLVARSLALSEAQRRFTETVDPPHEIIVPRPPSQRDPALLELEGSGEAEWLRLTVFPIMPGQPATVTVTFATPRVDRIELYAGSSLRDTLGSGELAPATAEDAELAAQPGLIQPGDSLYAAPAAPAPSEAVLASRFADVMPTLERCAAVDDATTVQHASIHVDVDGNGRAWLGSSEGAGVYLLDCTRQVLAQVQFGDYAPTSLTIPLDVTPHAATE